MCTLSVDPPYASVHIWVTSPSPLHAYVRDGWPHAAVTVNFINRFSPPRVSRPRSRPVTDCRVSSSPCFQSPSRANPLAACALALPHTLAFPPHRLPCLPRTDTRRQWAEPSSTRSADTAPFGGPGASDRTATLRCSGAQVHRDEANNHRRRCIAVSSTARGQWLASQTREPTPWLFCKTLNLNSGQLKSINLRQIYHLLGSITIGVNYYLPPDTRPREGGKPQASPAQRDAAHGADRIKARPSPPVQRHTRPGIFIPTPNYFRALRL